ncbi:MAG: lipoyl(octanoyl) transferase [Oceanicoccus sp.]
MFLRDSVEKKLKIRHFGILDYTPVWEAMQHFTNERDGSTVDEIWLLQHSSVFTQGQAGKSEHLLDTGDIPVIQVDRGGQVTYHGPGQLVAYFLIDLKRMQFGVRDLVTSIENLIVNVLARYKINSGPRKDAPGVYIEPVASGAKIAQLGLRIRRGCSFHGLSINVDMDMQPFQRINPCGHAGLEVTSIKLQKGEAPRINDLAGQLAEAITNELSYTSNQIISDGLLPISRVAV